MKMFKFKLFSLALTTLLFSADGYSQTYTFTNASATGINGPTQAQVNTAYLSSNLSGNVTVTAGIQNWTVPVGGLYKIEVYGANGYGLYGGKGAYMSGEFNLNSSDQLKILVGQMGGCCVGSGTNQYGGGGGTFVTTTANVPLIVSGGGGGAATFYPTNTNLATSANPIANATITQNGNNAVGTVSGTGGSAGNGGNEGSGGGGGGGFLTNANSQYGGLSFINGGTGGTTTGSGGFGGFGGGGGCNSYDNMRGGGGGGYSGGGGAGSSTTTVQIGGGGGSFNSGTNQINTPGLGTGHGKVVITLLTPAVMVPNNVGANGIPSLTTTPFCAGIKPITAKIRNFGNNFVDSVKVGWSVNGVVQTENWYQTDINSYPTLPFDTILSLGNYNFSQGTHTVKVWTSLPNNQVDTVHNNDTVSLSISTMMSGTYTINSAAPTAGTNFQNFTAFTTNLTTKGVCGPVIANVVTGSGPYNEQVVIGNIPGVSAVNHVRINGNNNTVQFATTAGANNSLLELSGAKYVRLDNLNFVTTSTTSAWGALITGGSEYDSLTNCTFNLSSVTATGSVNNSGIIFSASNTSVTTTGNAGSNCYIANNLVKGANGTGGMYYGISVVQGNNNNIIKNNIVENYYYYGLYVSSASGTQILGNTLHRTNKTASMSSYHFYTSGTIPNTVISGNKLYKPGGAIDYAGTFYGFYLLGDGTATEPVIFSNNLIYDINNKSTLYPIYLSASLYNKVYHNTIVIDKPLASSSISYGIYATGTNTGTDIINNNVSITSGTTGDKYGFYYSAASSVNTLQKNNFYVNSTQAGTQYYGYYTTAYTTQAAFQSAYPTAEVGSPAINPQFIAPLTANFTPANGALIGTGSNILSVVPTDINNIPRTASPTIGAFEVVSTIPNDASVMSMLNPNGIICATTVPVEAIIRNAGPNNITAVQINWSLNGVTQPALSYSGLLVPVTSTSGQNTDTVVVGNATLINGANTIKIWTSMPNGVLDSVNNNDTITTIVNTTNFAASFNMDTVCASGIANISLTPNSGYTAGAIQWQSSTNGTSWNNIANSDVVTYAVTGLVNTTMFRAKITNNGSICYSNIDTINVTNPSILTTTPAERCGPGTLTLAATAAPGTTLKWYQNATGGTSIGTGNSFTTPNISNSTTYYVAAGVGGGTSTNNTLSTVNTGGNGCGGGVMFDIDPNVNLFIDSFKARGNASATNVSVNVYTKSGTFQGSETNATAWTLLQTVVIPSTATGVLFNIPLTSPLTINANALTGIYIEYNASYSNLPTPTVYSNSDLDIIVGTGLCSSFGGTNLGRAFNGSVHYRTAMGCESLRQPVIATINPKPIINLGNNINLCPNTSTTINGTSPTTGVTYLWSNNATTPTISVSNPGVYSLTVNNGICTANDTVVVVAAPNPVATMNDSVRICDGNFATLDASNTGATYLWNNNSTTQTIDVNSAGQYTVNITNSFNCSIQDSVYVSIDTLPVVNLGNDTMVCAGTSLTLDAGNIGASYLWSTGQQTKLLNISQGGTYSVTVTTAANCTATDEITIDEFTPASVDGFTFIPQFNIEQGRVDFIPINPVFVDSFHWDFGDGNSSTLQTPSHVFANNGNYLVTLTISNECGSMDTSLLINVDLNVGVKTVRNNEVKINVYPVPSTDVLNIEIANGNTKIQSFKILNTLGQEVIQLAKINKTVTTVDVSNLISGEYFIYIVTDEGTAYRKFNIIK